MSSSSFLSWPEAPLKHVVRVIVKSNDKFLALDSIRNISFQDFSGMELPGGKVDLGTTALADGIDYSESTINRAAARELYEETGLKAASLQILSKDEIHSSAMGEGVFLHSMVFVHEIFDEGGDAPFTPILREPKKAKEIGYFSHNEIMRRPSAFKGYFDCFLHDITDDNRRRKRYPYLLAELPSTKLVSANEEGNINESVTVKYSFYHVMLPSYT
jgi:8-oxo-dGTP pyrophosphatase MutT (NUDIX family)